MTGTMRLIGKRVEQNNGTPERTIVLHVNRDVATQLASAAIRAGWFEIELVYDQP